MPRGRKKCRGLVHQQTERQGSLDSSGPPRVKETKLDHDIEGPPDLDNEVDFLDSPPLLLHPSSPITFGDCGSLSSPSRSFRDKITDFFSYSPVVDRPVSPPMPVLLPQVGPNIPDMDPLALPPTTPPVLDDCDSSDRSEGDSGKENDDVLVWRGSRSSLTSRGSRGSRPRSGHLSDIQPRSGHLTDLLGSQQPSNKPDRVTRSAVGKLPLSLKSCESLQYEFNIAETTVSSPQSPPTPHKIIRVKEVSAMLNPLQKLKQISLTPKKSSRSISTKTFKSNKKLGVQNPPQSVENTIPSSTKAGKLAAAAQSSHKVTEYFPIRRSERKPKAELLKEQMEGIEARLLATDDKDLDIEVANIEFKGRGIVTSRPFTKGEFVVEYAGDLMDIGMAKELEAKYSMDTSKGCYMYYFKHKGKQYCIDATGESGRYGRLLNHSRISPNCVTKVVMLGDIPRLILVAKQDIETATELLYDYGDRSKESLKAHPWLTL